MIFAYLNDFSFSQIREKHKSEKSFGSDEEDIGVTVSVTIGLLLWIEYFLI